MKHIQLYQNFNKFFLPEEKKVINEEYNNIININDQGDSIKYNVTDVPGTDDGVIA